MKEPIQVWEFEDAPEELKALSASGGDEDWLAVVPENYAGSWIPWMESGTKFGCCSVSEYPHPSITGCVVRIGTHS